uniref:G_PROTEIN_RECEP_F1_2 domain-containing protein n=1 Tax=Steinernema glaseri TaxID=37863 RepID=A0A1I7YNS8_9BILA
MPFDLESFYNIFLNATICLKLASYAVTFCVMFYNTPSSMRVLAKFMCNLLFWDFATHVVWVGFHAFPMMPLMCFRLDGVLASFFFYERFGHLFFLTFFTNSVNVATAIFLCFQFRLWVIRYGQSKFNSKKAQIYGYCIIVHLTVTAIIVGLYTTWPLGVDDYPEPISSEERRNLFCFQPRAAGSQVFLFSFIGFLVGIMTGIVVLVFLSFREVNKNRNLIAEKTAKLQKVFLESLLFLSGIPINIGGIPCVIICFICYFPEVHNAQLVVVICLLIASIYGPLMCVSTLLLFKPYRNAVKRVLKRIIFIGRMRSINTVHVSTVKGLSSRLTE